MGLFKVLNNVFEVFYSIFQVGPNCKKNETEAKSAWGSLVGGKIGYFESCGGDCDESCSAHIKPTLNSVMNRQNYYCEKRNKNMPCVEARCDDDGTNVTCVEGTCNNEEIYIMKCPDKNTNDKSKNDKGTNDKSKNSNDKSKCVSINRQTGAICIEGGCITLDNNKIECYEGGCQQELLCKKGPPYDGFYAVNEREIIKEIDKYS